MPDRAEILATTDVVLNWSPKDPGLPAVDAVQSVVEQLTEYGRSIAGQLPTQILSIPADSGAGISARAALGEASGRLNLPPPAGTLYAAVHRAQNLARLVQALCRAAGLVAEERARIARLGQHNTTTKGS
ncbi:DUF6415 family natural product biosynthesis protein [Streptomyces sp. NPDC101062]|uniref:DUF6415 family natural product biosynthesis protein n=1 Tax=unclassified Streptomyces TaxID=2593676 RepID=UPI003810D90E